MAKKKGSGPSNDICDVAHLIRSVQRIEGNPDCFGRSYENCDPQGCPWREYCLEEVQKAQLKTKNSSLK